MKRLILGGVLLFVSVATGPLGAQTSPAPTINLRRINALNEHVWPGDFNGDGITDLAASEPWSASGPPRVVIAMGRGDGTFGTATPVGWRGHVLAVADFNKDGKRDLLIGDEPVDDSVVYVVLGNGDGTFTTSHTVNSFDYPFFGLAADLDGDGLLDVIIGTADNSVQIYPGHADGTYPDFVFLTAGNIPRDGAVEDLNGDGRMDIVVANSGGHSLSVFLNQGAFNFVPSDIPFDRQVNDVVARDINGDGKRDLVVATSREEHTGLNYTDGDATVLIGNGDGTFRAPVSYPTARGAWQIVVGDFTRDGVLDIATANRSSLYVEDCDGTRLKTWDSVSILPGRSNGTFGAASSFSLQNQAVLGDIRFTNTVMSLNTSDLNGDGATDLIASWGAILINQPADPNWGPTVDVSQSFADTNAVHLRAAASDVDQDMLSYTWSASDGLSIPPTPTACVTGWATPGTHTYTVTVDDGHGHQASQSVTFTVSGGEPTAQKITFTSPAGGETVPAHQPYVIRWTTENTQSDGETLLVRVSTDGGSTWRFIEECNYVTVGARQCTWNDPAPITDNAQIWAITRDADFPANGTSAPFKIAVVPGSIGAVPSPWQHRDVGAVAAPGNATYDGSTGTFTVSGSGADIWGTADEFHYVYQQTIQRFEITARVDSVQNVNAWTKAGLMVRASLDRGAPHASIFVTPGKGVAFQRRTAQGATSIHTTAAALTAPVWLRLTMFNGNVWAYYKKNLTDRWTLVGGQALQMDPNVSPYIGLAVTSHADGTLASATFSHVRTGLIRDWNLGLIGCTNDGGSFDGTLFNMSSSCTDIWGTADAFNSVMTEITGDATITVHVNAVGPTHPWAKAGVMIRETKATGSKHAFAFVTPGRGVNLQYRAATGGVSASAASINGTDPGWLRLQRSGDTFSASWSTDGTTFVPIGSTTIAMSATVLMGMAHTSHNTETYGGALFDEPIVSR